MLLRRACYEPGLHRAKRLKRRAVAGLLTYARQWDRSMQAGGDSSLELKGHTDSVACLAFSADGTKLATGGLDGGGSPPDSLLWVPCASLRLVFNYCTSEFAVVFALRRSGQFHFQAFWRTEGADHSRALCSTSSCVGTPPSIGRYC